MKPRALLCLALAAAGRAWAQDGAPAPAQPLEKIVVNGTRPEFAGTAGPHLLDEYQGEFIQDTGAFTLDEFLQTLPTDLPGGERLVLIDGRPTRVNLNSLPLGMIDHLEVSRDGSMPQYGAYASGSVLNIVLKKNYRGGSLDGREQAYAAGGGGNRFTSANLGDKKGKLTFTFSGLFIDRQKLTADQRSFSRNQDHTALGGRDLRLLWGALAAVQAVNGSLTGVHDPSGQPVSTALVPAGQSGTDLTPASFLAGPAGVTSGAGLQRFNTAPDQLLATPNHGASLALNLTYPLTPAVDFTLSCNYSVSASASLSAPPVTPASAATLVPAALNPFGQDVEVGLVHTGFGPVRQKADSAQQDLSVYLTGTRGKWRWSGGLAHSHSHAQRTVTDLDPDKFALALTAADPGQRFNPFADIRASPHDLALYRSLAIERESENTSTESRVDLNANGPIAPGGGPVTLNFGGYYVHNVDDQNGRNLLGHAPTVLHQSRDSFSTFGNANAQLIDPKKTHPGLKRLDLQANLRFSGTSNGGSAQSFSGGSLWAPAKTLLFNANYTLNRSVAPYTALTDNDSLTGVVLIDLRRNSSAVSGVEVISGVPVTNTVARSAHETFGVTYEPPFAKGLKLRTQYQARNVENQTQRLSPQDVLYNEAAFPLRVVRAAPTAADLLLGQPGPVLSVDTTPTQGGRTQSRSANFTADYRITTAGKSMLTITGQATRVLSARYELAPGRPFISPNNGAFRPNWNFSGYAVWQSGAWSTSSQVSCNSGGLFNGAPYGSFTTIDVRTSYKFTHPVWHRHGTGLRLGVGVTNLLNEKPPYADTLNGFIGGSPLGRGYQVTVNIPL